MQDISMKFYCKVGNNDVKMAQRGQSLMAENDIFEFPKFKKKFFHVFKIYRSSFSSQIFFPNFGNLYKIDIW